MAQSLESGFKDAVKSGECAHTHTMYFYFERITFYFGLQLVAENPCTVSLCTCAYSLLVYFVEHARRVLCDLCLDFYFVWWRIYGIHLESLQSFYQWVTPLLVLGMSSLTQDHLLPKEKKRSWLIIHLIHNKTMITIDIIKKPNRWI